MKKISMIVLFNLVFQLVFSQVAKYPIRSISFPLIGEKYLDDNEGWDTLDKVLSDIKDLGFNDIKIVLSTGSYISPNDNLPNPDVWYNPSDEKILNFMLKVKSMGFKITVNPFCNVEFNPNGNLLDSVHAQPTDFNIWIKHHTETLVRFARLAEKAKADRFIVFGDEVQPLTFFNENVQGWINLITELRLNYSGKLTSMQYADGTVFNGNNNHISLTNEKIMSELDIIGIGWFPMPLTNKIEPTVNELVNGWKKNIKGVKTIDFLKNIHTRYNKPVYITDCAFHSFKGDNINSSDVFNMAIQLEESQIEQANEIESLIQVLSLIKEEWFLGLTIDSWNRFPLGYDKTARFLCSKYGENIKGKLAEEIFRKYYVQKK